MTRWTPFLVLLALAVGCGDDDVVDPDAGMRDTGADDASEELDAGPVDPVWDCSETGVDVYTPPDRLRDFDESQRGVVVRCGAGTTLSVETVRERAEERGYDGPELTSGASVTFVSYRTERRNGEGGFSSGTLYLPDVAGAADLPLIVHVSGTTGMADACAPSRARFADLERTLYVLIGSGQQAVFVPDLLGLGTPGPYAWLEPIEAAHSVLDGARAALAIAPEGALSGQILVSGHSAGGHAAFAAQAFQRSYAPELDVMGVNAMAPVWFDTASFGLLLSQSNYRIDSEATGWNVVYGAMYFIGHSVAYEGEARGYDFIAGDRRDATRTLFETRCLENPDGVSLREGLAGIATQVAELFDAGLRGSVGNCAFLGICDEVGMTWRERFAADRPPLDPDGPPMWVHLGTDDIRVPPSSMVCPIRDERGRGVEIDVCVYDETNHNVLARAAAPFTVALADALAEGAELPSCRDETMPPNCTE
ncbi:MAG: hypothetical protein KF901_23835 [Myxococcales bacterium]|nr:hypothetical protein [Myxococcales bacterium]